MGTEHATAGQQANTEQGPDLDTENRIHELSLLPQKIGSLISLKGREPELGYNSLET